MRRCGKFNVRKPGIKTMNLLQHYLTKLAEEGAEVSQIALKTQQFGPAEIMPGQPLNNFERCHLELDDMQAMIEELNEKFGFGYTPNRERIEAKKEKVRKFLAYSVSLGMVSDAIEPATGYPWAPMKSSPKDGTVVLALLEGSDIPHPVRWIEFGWQSSWDGHCFPPHDGPRCWMPIPEAPNQPPKGDD